MTVNETLSKTRRSRTWLVHRVFVAAVLLFGSITASAAGGRKLAPDFDRFPKHRDGTVDVIIRFKQRPQARHFQAIGARGGRMKSQLHHISGAAYRIPATMLAWLEKHPDVAYVSPDRPNKVAFDDAIPAVMGDLARQQFALDGTGVGIAVIDSGVYEHDDLQSADGTYSRIVYSESFVPTDPSTGDPYGHGTHVAGIIAGNGRDSQSGYSQHYMGLAPNANIINLRVLDANGSGADSQVIAAIGRAVELKYDYNIRVINLSLGRNIFESYTDDPLCQAVEAAWQAGIVVVVAAGNNGRTNSIGNTAGNSGYGTIQVPGNDPSVITVGATKTNGTPARLDDTIASYSSKGPSLIDHVVKPDLVAPGNRIVSLESPGSHLATTYSQLDVSSTVCVLNQCTLGPGGKYMRLSGTSMATPVVAAAAALMIQNDPSLTPDTVKARMMKTAWKGYPTSSWAHDLLGFGYFSHYDIFTVGAGYLDVDAALHNVDVADRSAASPTAVFDPQTYLARLCHSSSSGGGGGDVLWDESTVWATSVVWETAVTADSVIWDDAGVWSDPTVAANSVLWADSVIWEPGFTGDDVISYAEGEDGED
jgi:serine protease AprX